MRKLKHQNRVLMLALASGAAGAVPAIILLGRGPYAPELRWTAIVGIVACWVWFAALVRSSVIWPLQTLANMQAAMREGDYSVRLRGGGPGDALGELMTEANALSDMLKEQRLGAMEATALLRTVMCEIEVAVFAFDNERRLRLVNRAGEQLLAQNAERLLGRTAAELALADCLEGEPARTLEKTFPGRAGRWGIRRSTFRQTGIPHSLIVISDLSRALREEEREAWQRLVRVLGHELNNSLAPIHSIAQSLAEIHSQQPRPSDWEDDLSRGLRVISERSESLTRFMKDYSRLARLPRPQMCPVELGALVRGTAQLENRLIVNVEGGPETVLQADPDQLQQLLVNIIRNAVDASLETAGGARVRWQNSNGWAELIIEDDGPGLASSANLFVPFFTTKPGGSGIGLALSRQIAEAHGGSITLVNRTDAPGCRALIRLPS